MNFKSNKLRDAVIVALVASAATGGTAYAQETTGTTTDLDRISVTGSRIRQVDTETAQPVLSISRASIEKSGFKTVADVLQNISAAGSPAISRSEPLSSGENVGGFYIDLRNLGAQRTLILVDGKRLGSSTSGYQDVSQIPSVVVERIDVLKDGASSIYGSDAMAGVVNIITRKNFEGMEVNVYTGQYSEGDGEKQSFDFVAGFTGDRGSITIGAEYANEEEVWAKDRWFSESSLTSFHPRNGWTTVSQWGSAQRLTGGPQLVLNRGADPYDAANYHVLDSTPITGDVSNSNQQMHLVTPTERRSLFTNVQYDITDNVRFSGDLMYTRRESQAQVAGYPLQSAAYENLGAIWSADSFYNPFGEDMNYVRRGWEVPRVSTNQLTTFRFSGAVQGSFQFNDKYFDWEVGYLYQNSENLQRQTGNYNVLAANAATGESFYNAATGRVECGSAQGLIDGTNPVYGPGAGGCVPWNPLIPYGRTGDGGLTGNSDLQQFLFPTTHATGETTMTSYYANVAGSLFTLPAGDLGFALGYEYREEKGEFNPDALSQTGYSTDLASGPTAGTYDVNEFYLELNVPILADLPGAKELSVSAATRYSDFSTFGDTVNSKFGLKWRPIDQLLVRATYAEGFRAPTISDLYGGSSQTFESFTDPCDSVYGQAAVDPATAARCAAAGLAADYRQLEQGFVPVDGRNQQSPVPFTSGSNPELTPETSKSKTVGLVWSPTFAEGLNLSLDWFNIKIENTIVGDTPDDQLNDCYVLGVAERCTTFTRDATQGYVNSMLFGSRNAGFIETEGFDFDVAYRYNTDIAGNFTFNLQNTYVTKNVLKTTNDDTSPLQIYNGFESNFRLRSNLTVGWEMGDFGVTWGTRYFSGVKEDCYFIPDECTLPDFQSPDPVRNGPMNERGSTTFHDVQFSWNAPWNATVAVGARNVFDHYGPQMYSAPNSQYSYYGGYDIGRFIYMQYKQKF